MGEVRRGDGFMGISFPSSLDSGQASMFMTPPMAHQNPPHANPGLNPIDRLYSMQNSYFCAEEEHTMIEPWMLSGKTELPPVATATPFLFDVY